MLTKAVDKSYGTVTLTILRKKCGFAGMYPKYFIYDSDYHTLFSNAKKMPGNKTSNYLISCEEDVFSKDHSSFVGKLRSNFKKSKYLIYDNGENLGKNKNIGLDQVRCELGFVGYDLKGGQHNGTRSVTVAIPEVDETLQPKPLKQLRKEDSIATQLKHPELMLFENVKPHWSKTKNAYVLSFSDRVKCSSVKNFQLDLKVAGGIEVEKDGEVYLEFGKMSATEFTLSIKWPFSILNAFAIALSAFDK